MDAPRIQYAKTEDGVSIAYLVRGNGPPVILPPHLTGGTIELPQPGTERALDLLAGRCTVVQYDCRGMGMSQRNPIDFSIPAASLDLEAVVDRLGLSRFSLYANRFHGPLPLAYSAAHPERVSHLIIQTSNLRRLTEERAQQLRDVADLADKNFELYLNIASRVNMGWDSSTAAQVARIAARAHTPGSLKAANRAISALRSAVESYSASIRTPTLVLYSLSEETGASQARDLASLIEDAEVRGVPGAYDSDAGGAYLSLLAVGLVIDFIRPAPERESMSPTFDSGVLRTILFTDLADHTAMMQRLGDARGREVLRDHERITRETLAANGGTEVKAMGDGFMASFGSAQKALECAIALQRAFAARDEEQGTRNKEQGRNPDPVPGSLFPVPLKLHIGINAGEPIAEDDDLFGSSVILAARAAAKATAGQVLVTNVVRELVAGKGFAFADAGEFEMRGFEDPVRLFELRWQG